MAKKQGKTEFCNSIKSDHDRLHKLMTKYHSNVNEDSFRQPPWEWAQYEVYERTEKQLRRRKRGVMMHEVKVGCANMFCFIRVCRVMCCFMVFDCI